VLAGLLAVGTGSSPELPESPPPLPPPAVTVESGEAVGPVLLVLGEAVGVGVDVGVGVADGVGVGVAEAPVVGAGEAGTDAVGLAADRARVAGQPGGEVPLVVMPCDGLAEADGAAPPAPPSAEPPAVAVGVIGSQDKHGAGTVVRPVPGVGRDGAEVLRPRGRVLEEAPLTAPAPRGRPLAPLGSPPKVGVSAWPPLVSTVEPT
jgi:hypothetical protein